MRNLRCVTDSSDVGTRPVYGPGFKGRHLKLIHDGAETVEKSNGGVLSKTGIESLSIRVERKPQLRPTSPRDLE